MGLAYDWLIGNDYEGDRLVMGVSGDGRQNVNVAGYDNDQAGRDLAVRDQRDDADDAGILINGLAIDDASRGFEGACDIGGYYILTTLLQMHVFSLQALQVKNLMMQYSKNLA